MNYFYSHKFLGPVYFESSEGTYPFPTLSRYSAPMIAFFVVPNTCAILLALKLYSTKAFTSQVIILSLLGNYLAQEKNIVEIGPGKVLTSIIKRISKSFDLYNLKAYLY